MPIPATILSGFLGDDASIHSGLRIALIINDMSEVNVDAALVKSGSSSAPAVSVTRVEENIVELSNGCICCTLREDMVEELVTIAKSGKYDYVIIESSGIGEPMQVAEAFTMATKAGDKVSDYVRLDTAVTVVDAYNWLKDYNSADSLEARGTAAYEGDERHVVQLLVEQVQFANVIVLNKTDLVEKEHVDRVTAVLRSINKDARIIPTVKSAVPLAELMYAKLFNLEHAESFSGWLSPQPHVPETAEYGITSFVFRAKRPFHPDRLYKLLYPAEGEEYKLKSVVRSKGFFWLAVDGGMDDCGVWAHAGRLFQFTCGSPWWVTIPRNKWPKPVERLMGADADAGRAYDSIPPENVVWDTAYGDRRQEIVVIGIYMDHDAVKAALQDALVTPEEYALGRDVWDEWDDPFDFFPYEDELDSEEEEGDADAEKESAGHAHVHADGSTCNHNHHSRHPADTGAVRRVVTSGGVTMVRDPEAK